MAITIKTMMLALAYTTMALAGMPAMAQSPEAVPPASTLTTQPQVPATLKEPLPPDAPVPAFEPAPKASSVTPVPPQPIDAASLTSGVLANHSPGVYSVPATHSVAEADAKVAEVVAGRAAVASEFAAAEAICYNKFFTTICLDKAKEKRRVALVSLRAIEIEANHFKREEQVRLRDADLAERARKDAADEAQRQAEPPKTAHEPGPPSTPASGPSVAERIAEHNAKEKRQQADDAAKASQRAANVTAFQRKQAETVKHQADIAAKKAAKEADAKKKADAAAASAAASASTPAPAPKQ